MEEGDFDDARDDLAALEKDSKEVALDTAHNDCTPEDDLDASSFSERV